MTTIRTALTAVAFASAFLAPAQSYVPVAATAPVPAPVAPAPLTRPVYVSPVVGPPLRYVPTRPFATPEAAMRYLAAAYNARDLTALKRVTTPDARRELDDMRAQAVDLRLASCTYRAGEGDY